MSLDIVTINGVTLTYPKRWDESGRRTVWRGYTRVVIAIIERRIHGRKQCYAVLTSKGRKTLNEFNTVSDALRWIVNTGMVK